MGFSTRPIELVGWVSNLRFDPNLAGSFYKMFLSLRRASSVKFAVATAGGSLGGFVVFTIRIGRWAIREERS
jgi:hypothetical protein